MSSSGTGGAPAPKQGGGPKPFDLPKFGKLDKGSLGFNNKNTVSYVEITDPKFNAPEVAATIVLFTDVSATSKDDKAKPIESGEMNVIQKAFINIVKEATSDKEEFKKLYDKIYFR
jgi:hypothetical protein